MKLFSSLTETETACSDVTWALRNLKQCFFLRKACESFESQLYKRAVFNSWLTSARNLVSNPNVINYFSSISMAEHDSPVNVSTSIK